MADLEDRLASARSEQNQLASSTQMANGLYRNFHYFGESMVQLQSTLSNLAEGLASEKKVAVEAAQVSIDARQGTDMMVTNLGEVIDTVSDAVSNVEGLNARAYAIGHIVNLIAEISEQTKLHCLEQMASTAEADDSLLCEAG